MRTLVIDNLVEECRDQYRRKFSGGADKCVVIHRTLDQPGEAISLCKRFQTYGITSLDGEYFEGLASYTGGENPYHFLIEPDGTICQCIAMDERGAHARRWNSSGIAVAFMHDTTKSPLPHEMGIALVDITAPLAALCGGAGRVLGHDELPGGRADAAKVCPAIDMGALRAVVSDRLAAEGPRTPAEAEALLLAAGVSLVSDTSAGSPNGV